MERFSKQFVEDRFMTQGISRRSVLSGALKAGIGLAVWNELNLGQLSAFAITPVRATLADDKRFRPALARLDEFIAAHLRDMGAPGITLALATREGLLPLRLTASRTRKPA